MKEGQCASIKRKGGVIQPHTSTDSGTEQFIYKRRKVNYEEENRIVISPCNANKYPVRSLVCRGRRN